MVPLTPRLACRSIGDVHAFVQQLVMRHAKLPRSASHTGRGSQAMTARWDGANVPLYRLVNRSGLRVSYWARQESRCYCVMAIPVLKETL